MSPPALDPNAAGLKLFTIYLGVPVAVVLVLAVRSLLRRRDALPLLFLVGGLLASPLESVLCNGGLCTYPNRGQWTALSAFGVDVPVSTVFAYVLWMGGFSYLLARMFRRGDPPDLFWKLYGLLVIATLFIEYPSLHWIEGHAYYGKQPFWVAGLPLWWSAVNPMTAFFVAAVLTKLLPLLPGRRRLAIVVLIPMADAAAYAAVSLPIWVALNSGKGYAITYPAGFLTVALSLFVMWLVLTVTIRSRTKPVPPRLHASVA